MIVLCDSGFYSRQGNPVNLKVCKKGTWNQRMIVETVFSLFTRILNLKHLTHRTWPGVKTRLAYVTAAFNICINWEELSNSRSKILHSKPAPLVI